MVCTFFGHRDTPQEIKADLKNLLVDLIENKSTNNPAGRTGKPLRFAI
jgi:hypothetical protein